MAKAKVLTMAMWMNEREGIGVGWQGGGKLYIFNEYSGLSFELNHFLTQFN